MKEKKENGVEKSELEKRLKGTEFNAEDIKAYFDMVLDKGNLRYNNLEVIVTEDKNVSSIDVRPSDQNYDHPVVLIPSKSIIEGGIKLLQLAVHEIECHVLQNKFNYESGFAGASFGRDWETAQEGFAMRKEARIKKLILGDSFTDFEMRSLSYYILAMNQIKQGANIGEVYDYIFTLKKEESLAEGEDEKKAKEKAEKGAKMVIRRVTRGVYPHYFPKDIAYFKGELMAKQMEEGGVENYPLILRIDPALVPDMIKVGIYPDSVSYKKELDLARSIVEKMWKDKGWPIEYLEDKKWFADDFIENRKKYEDNMQMDRYVAYRKDFLGKDINADNDK